MIWNDLQLSDNEQTELNRRYALADGIAEKMQVFAEFFFECAPDGFVRCPYCKELFIEGNQAEHTQSCEELKQAEADQRAYKSNLADKWPE